MDQNQDDKETTMKAVFMYKDAGHERLKEDKFNEAANAFSGAIKMCPNEEVELQCELMKHRATALMKLEKYTEAKEDIDKMIMLDPSSSSSYHMRADVQLKTGDLQESLDDITIALLLDGYRNEIYLTQAERTVEELAFKKVKQALLDRKYCPPSKYAIKLYFKSFCSDPITLKWSQEINEVSTPEEPAEEPVKGFQRAKIAFASENFDEVIPACTEEIESGTDNDIKTQALLLRGTMQYLGGDWTSAIEDFTKVINSGDIDKKVIVNALIKRGALQIQLNEEESGDADFKEAEKLDPENADVYYHRQLYLADQSAEAEKKDYDTVVSLAPDFPMANIHRCFSIYRQARTDEQMDEAFQGFYSLLRKFPNVPEALMTFAQVLSDLDEGDDSAKFYRLALTKDPNNAAIVTYQALLDLQYGEDVDECIRQIKYALQLDDRCCIAYKALGTVEARYGNLEFAIHLFDKAIQYAQTAYEMWRLIMLKETTKSQINGKSLLDEVLGESNSESEEDSLVHQEYEGESGTNSEGERVCMEESEDDVEEEDDEEMEDEEEEEEEEDDGALEGEEVTDFDYFEADDSGKPQTQMEDANEDIQVQEPSVDAEEVIQNEEKKEEMEDEEKIKEKV